MRKRISVPLFLLMSFYLSSQTAQFDSFDGTTIVYTDEGKGKPILLIHGFINSRKNWDKSELKKELLAQGYRVIIPDLRGNGDSDKPQDDEAYQNDAEVKDLMALMNHLKIKKYKAVGYSRGSIVLAKLLTQDKRVKKAVLGGMGIDFTNPNWDMRIMFADAFAGNTNKTTQGAVDYAKSINADLRSLHLQQKYQPVTTKKELAIIRLKVLVLSGDIDTSNGNKEELATALPKGELQIINGDHNNTYKSKGFADAVMAFL
ncbi:alpha/beta hydrolase [bacterium]|nr:alpha/beta hydrolase [bacterium]